MSYFLKQSTSVTIKFGPFLDEDDGKTAETGLAIAQADIRLSKNGANIAQTNNSAGATADELGFYDVPLDDTDTGTLGSLLVAVHESGALPVFQYFMVVSANVWDSLFGSDKLQVHAAEISAALITATSIAGDAITEAKIADNAIAAEHIAADAIGASEIADNAIDAGAIATDAIDADALKADAVTEITTGILTTQMTEAYASDGSAPTLAQAVFAIQQFLQERAVSGTTLTVKGVDGSTSKMTFTLDDASAPTSITRAS